MNTPVDVNAKPKLQEHATEAQIEFFDRLRSGDDPVHEEARIELVELAGETLDLLYSLRVDKHDFDPDVRRVLWRLSVLAGTHDPEQFYLTLEGRAGGVDLSAVKVDADANLTEDEQLISTLLTTEGIELVESFQDKDPLCGGQEHVVYAFVTRDHILAEEYGFVSEFADEEVQS
jgi:hypothetical protein